MSIPNKDQSAFPWINGSSPLSQTFDTGLTKREYAAIQFAAALGGVAAAAHLEGCKSMTGVEINGIALAGADHLLELLDAPAPPPEGWRWREEGETMLPNDVYEADGKTVDPMGGAKVRRPDTVPGQRIRTRIIPRWSVAVGDVTGLYSVVNSDVTQAFVAHSKTEAGILCRFLNNELP